MFVSVTPHMQPPVELPGHTKHAVDLPSTYPDCACRERVLSRVAHRTHGHVAADLSGLCREALMCALRRMPVRLDFLLLQHAFRQPVMFAPSIDRFA